MQQIKMENKKRSKVIIEALYKVVDKFLKMRDFIDSTVEKICLREQSTVE